MTEVKDLEARLVALRQEFDHSFVLPPEQSSSDHEDLLAVRVAGDAYALRLREVSGIVSKPKVMPIPTQDPDLIGLAGIRGGIIPVFRLEAFLGAARSEVAPRWMVLVGTVDPIAFAFQEFDGYWRLPRSALHADERLRAQNATVSELARKDGEVRAVIQIPLIVSTLRNRAGRSRPDKEQ